VPRWPATTSLQVNAFFELLKWLGKFIISCHSQSGEIGLGTACAVPQNVAGVIAVEPSSNPQSIESLNKIPIVILQGDFLDASEICTQRASGWCSLLDRLNDKHTRASIINLPAHVGSGKSHFPMMDKNSEACLECALSELALMPAI